MGPLANRCSCFVPRRRPLRHPGELGIVGEPRGGAGLRLRQVAAVRRVIGVDQRAQRLARLGDRRGDRCRIRLEQRAQFAGVEAAGQVPVGQFLRRRRTVPAPNAPAAAIAASSSSCGARPASTSFWLGGVPVL